MQKPAVQKKVPDACVFSFAAVLSFAMLLLPLFPCRTAAAQKTGQASKSDTSTLGSGTARASRTPRVSKPKGPRDEADRWMPPDVDQQVPPVKPDAACSLPAVLSGAGKQMQELVSNVARFTATEIVQHQGVDHAGRLRSAETHKFSYLVSIAQKSSSLLNVEEYRKGYTGSDVFPDHVTTQGMPSLVLIFHPLYAKDFNMQCEGLGEWRERPAWQVRFEQRPDSSNRMATMVIGGHAFNIRLRGRAWILADSYQVARLETDLAERIPAIRLRVQHQDIEYAPVHFTENQPEIWLPSSADLYMDFVGHQFYRRHSFTDFRLFSVKIRLGDSP